MIGVVWSQDVIGHSSAVALLGGPQPASEHVARPRVERGGQAGPLGILRGVCRFRQLVHRFVEIPGAFEALLGAEERTLQGHGRLEACLRSKDLL